MQKRFLGLSGMPRSGTTLLSSILCQNPNIYSEGTSPLGHIMYETFNLLQKNSYNEMFNANKRPDTFFNIVSGLPEIYYNKVNEPIIIDKSRVWTGQECLYIMSNFITSTRAQSNFFSSRTLAAVALTRSRLRRQTACPSFSARSAQWYPRPAFPPVMITNFCI